jgi:hypothetical protein
VNCQMCRWFKRSTEAWADHGSCQRHAPVLVPIGGRDAATVTLWPRVHEDWRCGDWQAKETETCK